MIQEERIQDREIRKKLEGASRKRRAMPFVCTAIGELQVFQEQDRRYQLPPMEEICQFCQDVKWKDETGNICYSDGNVLTTFYDSPQEFKCMPEDPLFLLIFWRLNYFFF